MKISLGGITDNKHNKYFRIEGRLAIMNISKFTQKSVEAVQNCEKLAYEYGNQQLEQEFSSSCSVLPVFSTRNVTRNIRSFWLCNSLSRAFASRP